MSALSNFGRRKCAALALFDKSIEELYRFLDGRERDALVIAMDGGALVADEFKR